ncbi:MAG TPA: DoxX family protein [Nitrosopumilaceae archaeon]|nr:DoxX family protein [Nitrosopumilaceae archaeon]
MTEAKFRESKLHDIVHFGVRVVVGTIFIAHSLGKFDPGFVGFLNRIGIPAEMQFLIALAEFVPGILLIIGVLTRISASILSIIALGVIFHVKHASNLTGQGGFELELLLLVSVLSIIVAGPGRVSLSHIIKKIPRFLQ